MPNTVNLAFFPKIECKLYTVCTSDSMFAVDVAYNFGLSKNCACEKILSSQSANLLSKN